MKIVLVEREYPFNCTGCRICEMICTFTHDKVFNALKARIRVTGIEPFKAFPTTCQQCIKPKCADNCPTDAITRDADGVVRIDESLCSGCEVCIKDCPFGAISLHPDKGVAIKCDLCGGDPMCVKWCPREVLKLGTYEDLIGKKRRRDFAKKTAETVEEMGSLKMFMGESQV